MSQQNYCDVCGNPAMKDRHKPIGTVSIDHHRTKVTLAYMYAVNGSWLADLCENCLNAAVAKVKP